MTITEDQRIEAAARLRAYRAGDLAVWEAHRAGVRDKAELARIWLTAKNAELAPLRAERK